MNDTTSDKNKLTFEKKDYTDGYVVLSLIGDLDMWTLPQAKEEISKLLSEKKVKVILDLGKTNYVDSSGLGFFIGTLKKLKDAGGDLIIINLNAYISRIFQLIKLQFIIKTYNSLEEASKNFNSQNKGDS